MSLRSEYISYPLKTLTYWRQAIWTMCSAWVSDKYRQRAAVIAMQATVTITGLFLTGYAHNGGWRYAGSYTSARRSSRFRWINSLISFQVSFWLTQVLQHAFLESWHMCVSPQLDIHSFQSWILTKQRFLQSSNNIVSQTKRAVSTAITVMFGGLGGIIASLVFRQVDSPRYRPGIYATIASQFLMLILLAITTLYYRRKNKSIQEGTATKPLEGRVGFLYTL